MKHSLALEFKGAKPSAAKDADGAKVYSAVASTPALDRYKEVLLPLGMEYSAFLANPVLLMLHNYHSLPVGKVIDISVTEKSVEFDFVFADSDEGREVQKMFDNGFMNAFSVGLYPKAYTFITDETADQLELEVANGKKQKVDLSVYKERPEYIVNQWELLEISPVTVPANPEALLKREVQTILRKSFDGKGTSESGAAGQILEARVNGQLDNVLALLKGLEDFDVEAPLSVVEAHSCPTVDDTADGTWSAAKALVDAAVACSSDASGEKEKMDWGKFSKAFAWLDVEKAANFSAYEFPHHTYSSEGELQTSVSGVREAMAKLLSAPEVDDAQAVYAHLLCHYEDAKLEAPEFKLDYSEAEVATVADGTFGKAVEDSDVGDSDDSDSDDSDASVELDVTGGKELLAKMAAMSAQLKETEKTISIRLGVQFDLLTALKSAVEATRVKEVPTEDDEDSEGDVDLEDHAQAMVDVSSMLERALAG